VGTSSLIFLYHTDTTGKERVVELCVGIAMFAWLAIDARRSKRQDWISYLLLPFALCAVGWLVHLLPHHHRH
jgi:hypothetical protein